MVATGQTRDRSKLKTPLLAHQTSKYGLRMLSLGSRSTRSFQPKVLATTLIGCAERTNRVGVLGWTDRVKAPSRPTGLPSRRQLVIITIQHTTDEWVKKDVYVNLCILEPKA